MVGKMVAQVVTSAPVVASAQVLSSARSIVCVPSPVRRDVGAGEPRRERCGSLRKGRLTTTSSRASSFWAEVIAYQPHCILYIFYISHHHTTTGLRASSLPLAGGADTRDHPCPRRGTELETGTQQYHPPPQRTHRSTNPSPPPRYPWTVQPAQ